MLLCSTMAFSQSVKVEVKLDTLFTLVEKKDKEIKYLQQINKALISKCNKDAIKLEKDIDSLSAYKRFYDSAHKLLAPRLIARIEDEMKN